MVDSSYTWIPITCAVFAFIASYGMGGNDVSNSFATSIGAKALTLKQTIVIASVCEFSGAIMLGHKVTETIKGAIINASMYEDNPTLLMYGMFTVVIGCAVWLVGATFLSLPVSSTHTCIGGMLGMGIVSRGFKVIHWKTVINVILSWLYSPLIAGFISFACFLILRSTILLKEKSFEYSLNLFCPLIAFILTLNFFVIFYGGCPWLPNFNWWMSIIVSASISSLIALILYFAAIPAIRRKGLQAEAELNQPLLPDVESNQAEKIEEKIEGVIEEKTEEKIEENSGESSVVIPVDEKPVDEKPVDEKPAEISGESSVVIPVVEEKPADEKPVDENKGMFDMVMNDETVAAIHERTEHYDVKTEKTFIYLQVLAAILNSFAHGANDVSHSIGPFVACLEIYHTGTAQASTPTPAWILAFGATGIVLGLATIGYKVMATVGVNLVSVTPCRGFFIELASSFVVIVGSRIGIPLSTTQCKIGAAVGIGLVGGSESVNWKLFGKIFGGWILTIVVAAIVSAILMELGVLIFHF